MKKSLFAKYFSIYAVIIIISISFLGAVLLLFSSQFFKEDKYKLLNQNVESLQRTTVFSLTSTTNNSLDSIYSMFGSAIEADIYMVGTQGDIRYSSFATGDNEPSFVSSDVLDKVLETYNEAANDPELFDELGNPTSSKYIFKETGTLDGLYSTVHYNVAVPLVQTDSYTNKQVAIGYLFVSASAESLNAFLSELFRMFIISALAVMFVAFIIIYFVTLQMIKPLRQMSAAAKRFGSSDFTARINVRNEDEIGELALALNNMAQDLSAVEASRRSFTANVSHELRTPMTSISGFVDGILDGTIPPEKHREYLNIVSTEIKRLSRLVRSMLNMSRIESGQIKLQMEEFDINDVILQTIFSFEKDVEKKHLDIRGLEQTKIMAYADKGLVHQVIYNLTENAIKFSNEGGYLEFSYKTEDQYLYVSIKNSGEGLSKEESNKVFERFYKADKSRGLDTKGVGLGLHIVKSIINLHKGEILVDSVPGEYSEFTFSVPLPKKQAKNKNKSN